MIEESRELKQQGMLPCVAIQCRLQDFINRHGYASLTPGSPLVFHVWLWEEF